MRVTIPRLLSLVFAVVLAGYVFVLAPKIPGLAAKHDLKATPAGPPAPARPKPVKKAPAFPLAGKKFVGIMTSSGPYDFTDLDKFSRAVGQQPSVYEFAQGWAVNQFDRSAIDRVADRGMLPLISWEPWDYRKESPVATLRGDQPAYSLSNIIDGRYDSYIRSWAKGVKSLGYTIAIRFAHEMNGYWYPWGIFANGNKASQYVVAWRHVHDIFTQVGAKNVIWVWSPNIIWNSFTDLGSLYPGNSYVDWIGLSGYYGTPGMGDYQSFDEIFDRTITDLRTFTHKPIVITETGATNVSGLMASWITQMFKELPDQPDIIGVIWFEAFDVIDWRVADDPAAGAAFAAGLKNPMFRIHWRPGMRALLSVPSPETQPGSTSTTAATANSPPTTPPPTATANAVQATRPATPTTPAHPSSPPSRRPTPRPSPLATASTAAATRAQ